MISFEGFWKIMIDILSDLINPIAARRNRNSNALPSVNFFKAELDKLNNSDKNMEEDGSSNTKQNEELKELEELLVEESKRAETGNKPSLKK